MVKGYDINDPYDWAIIEDTPYSELNKKGRKAKRKRQLKGIF